MPDVDVLEAGFLICHFVVYLLDGDLVDVLVQPPDVEVLLVLLLLIGADVVDFWSDDVREWVFLLDVPFSLVDVPFRLVDVLLASIVHSDFCESTFDEDVLETFLPDL